MDGKPTAIAAINMPEIQKLIVDSGNSLTTLCHSVAYECGWWDETTERDIPRLLMLCVSELAEAMEGHRKDLMDDHLPERKMVEVELADTVIRFFTSRQQLAAYFFITGEKL